jgi:DNA-binding beta-propeller fold protein YncE
VRTRVLLLTGLLLLLLVAPAAVVLLLRGNGEPKLERLRVADLPTDVAAALDRVWVASAHGNRLVELLDASPPGVLTDHRTGVAPLRVATDGQTVWATAAGDDTVTWLRAAAIEDSERHTLPVGGDAVDVGISADAGWVSNGAQGTVTRIDPVSFRLLGPAIRTGRFPTAVAVGDLYVWVVNSGDGTLVRVDPRENLVVGRRIPVGRDPQDVAIAAGSVWVANHGDSTVTRVSSRTGRPQAPALRLPGPPSALAPLADGVLVLDSEHADVLKIDAKRSRVSRIVHIGGTPTGLAVSAEGSIWVADARAGTATRVGPPSGD